MPIKATLVNTKRRRLINMRFRCNEYKIDIPLYAKRREFLKRCMDISCKNCPLYISGKCTDKEYPTGILFRRIPRKTDPKEEGEI
jgi:excisionase family DNA binding protein